METIYVEKIQELRRKLKNLEKELGVKITLKGKMVTIEGEPLKEYETSLVLDAISFGFSVETSLLLKNEDITLRIINIKDHTKRKNLKDIRSRIIGTHGKTKETLEQISSCRIIVKDNEVGLLGHAEEIEYAIAAIIKIIKGSKQSNVYSYLERINTENKKIK